MTEKIVLASVFYNSSMLHGPTIRNPPNGNQHTKKERVSTGLEKQVLSVDQSGIPCSDPCRPADIQRNNRRTNAEFGKMNKSKRFLRFGKTPPLLFVQKLSIESVDGEMLKDT